MPLLKITSFATVWLSIALLSITPAFAAPAERPPERKGALLYQIHRKDHVAEVLRSMGFQNLWGTRGMVARTIEANENLRKNPNDLETGHWLYIPASQLPTNSSYTVVNGEIQRRAGGQKPQEQAQAQSQVEKPAQSTNTIHPPGQEPLPPEDQVIHVQCPDQSLREARVRLVTAKAPGQHALIVVLDKDGICAPASGTEVAAPLPPLATAPTTDTSPLKTAPPSASERAASTQVEEIKPESAAPAPVSRNISQLPFIVSPLASYISDPIQFGGAMGSPNISGFTYGARIGYVYRPSDWGYMIELAYRQGMLSTTDGTSDFVTMSTLEYGLGLSYHHWTFRAGVANNSLTDADIQANISFADRGYYGSVAYSFFFNARTSFTVEGRYTGVTYTQSKNSALAGDAQSTQIEGLVGLDYRFALW